MTPPINNPSVCAIIPTYNRACYIGECLDSLLAQSYPLAQIIVVNDGSTDHTEDILAPYRDKTTYIKKDNGGKSSALNLALQSCTSDYVWICDDDDYADKDGLKHLITALENHPDADYALGRFKIFHDDDTGRRHFKDQPLIHRADEPNAKINFLENMFTFQFAALIKHETYQTIGPFREDLIRSQDYEMMIRLSRHHKAAPTKDIVFYQRAHSGQRGSQAAPLSYDALARQWLSSDQIFFTAIARDYKWSEFTPSFALDWPAPHKQRAAYLQKALILGQKALWHQAYDALNTAVEKNAAPPLSAEEKRLCETVIQNPNVWDALYNEPALQHKIKRWAGRNDVSALIIFSLLRPLRWMSKAAFKERNFDRLYKNTRILLNILGPLGTVKRLLKKP